MKLGACYNVFDGEELLEASIISIRDNVDFVVVVYQTISNFGYSCDKGLLPLLEGLVRKGLVQELVHYTPKTFSNRSTHLVTVLFNLFVIINNPLSQLTHRWNSQSKLKTNRRDNGLNGEMNMTKYWAKPHY